MCSRRPDVARLDDLLPTLKMAVSVVVKDWRYSDNKCKKSSQYEQGRPVRPWLYTIATHQAIDALRRNNRHQALSLDQDQKELPDGEVRSLLELLETRGPGPVDLAHGEERRERVRASVDRLPEFLRQVVILAYYQGLKYREIADILGIPVGTVKSRLHAALMKLQEAWAAAPSLREA